jgi:hypothetical protein
MTPPADIDALDALHAKAAAAPWRTGSEFNDSHAIITDMAGALIIYDEGGRHRGRRLQGGG